jgi:hypothetical protein
MDWQQWNSMDSHAILLDWYSYSVVCCNHRILCCSDATGSADLVDWLVSEDVWLGAGVYELSIDTKFDATDTPC